MRSLPPTNLTLLEKATRRRPFFLVAFFWERVLAPVLRPLLGIGVCCVTRLARSRVEKLTKGFLVTELFENGGIKI
jgi:hypothetical protein